MCPDIKAVFICITLASKQTIIGARYRAPNVGSEYCGTLHTLLLDIRGHYPKADFVIFGDFNFPNTDWVHFTTNGSNDVGEFPNNCLNFNLTQVVEQPTCGYNRKFSNRGPQRFGAINSLGRRIA